MNRMIVVALPLIILILQPLIQWTSWFPEPSMGYCLFMAGWMVTWWIAEILPLGITALLPMIFLPLLNILPLKEVTATYANPVIYLFLGGFIIARGLEKTGLSKRIALMILRATGKSDSGIILGFMLATTLMSMWISNTATTVMMVPIGMSIVAFLEENLPESSKAGLKPMSIVLFLSIAYCANIGGIMTPVGTPPNVVLLGFINDIYKFEVDFWRWLLMASPVAITLLYLQYFLMRKVFPFQVDVGGEFQHFLKTKLRQLGELNGAQRVTIFAFSLTAFLWVFKGLIHWSLGVTFLNDTSIAILGGLLLFLLPTTKSLRSPTVLNQSDLGHLPWNIVLLFGGGMAMASALKSVGLIQLTTQSLASLGIESPYLMVMLLAAVSLILTEIMSNVALCVVALPVMMELGVGMGMSPLITGIPVAISTSFAFSMPISTPPNAIVFGTGLIRVSDMMRVGVILNLLGFVCLMTVGWLTLHLLL
jgi:sodium-dependent dicarboxylate transporter 2/3/5